MYATTNIQLYNQMKKLGYRDEDINLMHNSYEVAKELCTCLHRPSGNTHISHLIGTASILVSLKVPLEISAAGLLHSIYTHGEFGDGEHKIKDFKRKYLRERVGDIIEEYVAGYANLRWFKDNTVSDINNNIENLTQVEKDVVLMRIADALDEFNYFGNLYVPNPELRIKYFEDIMPTIIEISQKLGYPELGERLKTSLSEQINHTIPEFLRNSENGVFLVPPLGYRQTANIQFLSIKKKLKPKIRRIRKIIRKVKL